ncbi:SLATT domain-containing protein [Pseudofrankia sp. DC12]|uniref:SLATT domain-containing protein n=1 Tax=Pseudofrankia sp. DC12 TaxID=683315 RepID=UPI000A691C7C|nr:SLATT domain-containing protein [Pseudofrankia sp. DC12]
MVLWGPRTQPPPQGPRSPLAPVAAFAGTVAPTDRAPWLAWRPRAIGGPVSSGSADLLPVVSSSDWKDTEAVLAALYRRLERKAIDAADRHRRRGHDLRSLSHLLRVLAVLLAAVGVLLPVIAASRHDIAGAAWCSLFFGAALALLAIEHVCGLSAAAARGHSAATRAQRRLEIFQEDWTAACVPGAADGTIPDRLAILRSFTADLRTLADRGPADGAGELSFADLTL